MGIFLHDKKSPSPVVNEIGPEMSDDEIVADGLYRSLISMAKQLESMAEEAHQAAATVQRNRTEIPKNISTAWDKENYKVLQKIQPTWKALSQLSQKIYNTSKKFKYGPAKFREVGLKGGGM